MFMGQELHIIHLLQQQAQRVEDNVRLSGSFCSRLSHHAGCMLDTVSSIPAQPIAHF